LILGRKNLGAMHVFVRVNVIRFVFLLLSGARLAGGVGDILRVLLRVVRLRAKFRCAEQANGT